jgi:hypothetical protein
MKIFSPTISGSSQASGSLTISGSLNVSQGITGSLFGTASWATNVVNGGGGSTDTGSLLKTASVNLNTITFTKGDGSTFPITVNTGSGGGGGSVGTLAQVTALGASTTVPITASIISASSFTGSLFGTASWATNASTAILAPNYVLTSVTSSMLAPYVLTSVTSSMLTPYLLISQTSSFVKNNQTSSFVLNSQTSSMLAPYVLTSVTSSMLAPYVLTSVTSSFVKNSQTSSMSVLSSSFSLTSSLAARNLLTASVSSNTITFTKGDGSTFNITVNTGSGGGGGSIGTLQQVTEQGASTTIPITASIVSASSFTGSLFGTASHAITASYALSSAGGGGGSFSLAGATDVSFSALADGDLIRYSSIAGKWQNTNLGLSLTPTLSAIEGGYFGGYTKITNWGSYSAPLAQAFIKSGSTIIITCSVNSSGQITWSDSNSNYNFTRSLEVQVQDFGDIASEIATASYVKQEASFRYFRYYAVSASSYVWIGELRYYSGSAQSGTAFPANMTSNTAPSPYVISASNFYVGYEPWKAFDNNNNTYWWNLAAPPYQGAYITVDMGSDFTSSIRSMRVLFGSTYQDFTFANFQGSNDNITWTTIHTITNVPANNISTMRNFG